MKLVPGRDCGECTVCCTVAPIAAPELRKGPNTPCAHCTGAGCGIYDRRPGACRDSFCGWRAYAELDEAWRPDISGVLILAEADAPASRDGRPALKFLLVNDDAPLQSDRLVGYLAALVGRGVPVTLSVQGPPGAWPVKTFVNAPLEPALRRRDLAEARRVLLDIARRLRDGAFEPAVL